MRGRAWTAEEDRKLAEIVEQNRQRIIRGSRQYPAGRLKQFALMHGRTYAAVKMRAKRMGLRSRWIREAVA